MGASNGVRAISSRVVATCFALISFAAAVLVGIQSGNDAANVILRAVAVILVCYFVGLVIGSVANRAIEDHVARYKKTHPIPQTVEDLPEQAPETGLPT